MKTICCRNVKVKEKSFLSYSGLQGRDGADLRFFNPQAHTCLHCKTMDTGLVYCTVYLFTPQPLLALIVTTHRGMASLR